MSSITSVRWVALDTFISKGVTLLSFVLVARVLGPEMMGTVAVLILVKELAVITSDFGLSQAIIHYQQPTKNQLATLYSINWFLGFSAFGVGLLSTNSLASIFDQPQLIDFLPVVVVGFLLEPIGQQVNALLQKMMDFKVIATISIVAAVLGAIISIGGVYSGYGVWAVVIAGLVSSGAKQLAYLMVARRRHLLHGFALDFKQSKDLLSFGMYRTGATGLNLLNSRVDQFIVGGMLGGAALGLYSMATNFTLMTMQQINGIATRVAFPAISKLQTDEIRVRSVYLRLVNRASTVNAAIYFGLFAVAEPLVFVIFGPSWILLVPLLQLMCGYVLLRSLGNLNGPLAMGLGKANWAFYWNLGLTAIVPATLWFSSLLNSVEIVVVALISLQLMFVAFMYLYWIRRLIGPCLREYVTAICVPWSSGVIMVLAIHIALQFASSLDSPIKLGIALLTGAIVYVAASWLINRDGISEILALFLRRRKSPLFSKKG